MKPKPRITDTEWEVMRVVWDHHPLTATAIVADLQRQDATWHPKTVRTLLTRLVQKGALDFTPEGRSYVYRPLVAAEDCIAAESESFVTRVFGGSLRPMLAHFVERQRLTKADLQALRGMLDAQEKNHPRGQRHADD
jgi:BlaI family transcriptional regulator, penicillinase repressor